MALRERVEAAISKYAEMFEDPEYARLRDFYEEMRRKGAVLKKDYDFSAQDSLGSVYGEQTDIAQPSGLNEISLRGPKSECNS
ncbi:MAG: hypothetical protein QOH70_4051 [Blastocatellia bacterium]|nr:hypothetical protein [Blastocatellia bacterium]